MELWETKPLPCVCRNCTEEDCYGCDYAGLRWQLDRGDELAVRKKMLDRAIKRLQKQVNFIDEELRRIKEA